MFICCAAPDSPVHAELVSKEPEPQTEAASPTEAASLPEPPEEEEEPEDVTSVSCSFEGRLAVTLDCWPNCVQVASIKAVGDGGEALDPNLRKIQALDFVTEVDGVKDPREMLRVLRDNRAPQLLTVNPKRLTVELDKGGQSLGMNLLFQELSSTSILIKGIDAGAVQRYNADSIEEETKVCVNDFIESVNGVSGSAERLLEQLKQNDTIEMVLMRRP